MSKKIFLVIGMAGCGKTTLCERLYTWLSSQNLKIDTETGGNSHIYTINLDPAVENTKIPINLDIRDYVDFREVMEKYDLGPNGAIMTTLNLFLLNMKQIETNAEYLIIDTPGQIESFIWAGAGFAVIEILKRMGDLKILYVADSYESKRHLVYISNMMYAASLRCRYNCNIIVIFNKSDLANVSDFYDYENFRSSLPDEFYSPLLSSMILHFEDFFTEIPVLSLSSTTSEGKDEFLKKISI